ncbi:tudor and KH domain-containing protein [Strigops habroptila]|uniref:Tudor and KH domain containing n=1 Tax=Strigops habroptila TaxID=2489341 RepID=A0A672UN37_STRHB|nr:tudor and KH domain-containing protein [Strigops habroptila]
MAAARGYWSSLLPLQKAAVVLGVPAGTAVLYILYRRYRESREERQTFVGDEELEVEMRVPRAVVKSIIGRRGATIKKLRQETGARIDVEGEEEGEEAALLISGSPVQVCQVKAAIHQIVAESTPVSEQLCVPQRAVSRIIGRGGETVRGICRSSGARVLCEREAGASLCPVRAIQLSGTRKEVEAAKKLIMEKLMEDNVFRRELAQAAVARCQRKALLGSRWEPEPLPNGALEHRQEHEGLPWGEGLLSLVPSEETVEQEAESEELEEPGAPMPKFEVPSPDFAFDADEHLEVYISAAESPDRFWMQLVGQRSLQLDKLMAEMRQYYQHHSPAALLSDVQPGDIVAAPFAADGNWYRARVLGPQDNGNLGLHYVDFGDGGEAPRQALCALRSDFLSLPFQAVECGLAGVVPTGAGWEPAALDAFAQLTHCATWEPLLARIASYGPTAPCPRPRVRLFAVHGGVSLDVGTELVRLGHAVPRPCHGEPEEEEEEEAPQDAPVPPVAAAGAGEPGDPPPAPVPPCPAQAAA